MPIQKWETGKVGQWGTELSSDALWYDVYSVDEPTTLVGRTTQVGNLTYQVSKDWFWSTLDGVSGLTNWFGGSSPSYQVTLGTEGLLYGPAWTEIVFRTSPVPSDTGVWLGLQATYGTYGDTVYAYINGPSKSVDVWIQRNSGGYDHVGEYPVNLGPTETQHTLGISFGGAQLFVGFDGLLVCKADIREIDSLYKMVPPFGLFGLRDGWDVKPYIGAVGETLRQRLISWKGGPGLKTWPTSQSGGVLNVWSGVIDEKSQYDVPVTCIDVHGADIRENDLLVMNYSCHYRNSYRTLSYPTDYALTPAYLVNGKLLSPISVDDPWETQVIIGGGGLWHSRYMAYGRSGVRKMTAVDACDYSETICVVPRRQDGAPYRPSLEGDQIRSAWAIFHIRRSDYPLNKSDSINIQNWSPYYQPYCIETWQASWNGPDFVPDGILINIWRTALDPIIDNGLGQTPFYIAYNADIPGGPTVVVDERSDSYNSLLATIVDPYGNTYQTQRNIGTLVPSNAWGPGASYATVWSHTAALFPESASSPGTSCFDPTPA